MKILFKVSCNDEYFDEYPSTAIIEFTKESIERILSLMDKIKELGVVKICDWDNLEWLSNNPVEDNDDPEEWNGRHDCDMAHIYDTFVSWYAYIKDTGIQFGTYDSLYKDKLKDILKFVDEDILVFIYDLEEVIKVYKTPLKKLPLLVGVLKSEIAKKIYSKRLREGN